MVIGCTTCPTADMRQPHNRVTQHWYIGNHSNSWCTTTPYIECMSWCFDITMKDCWILRKWILQFYCCHGQQTPMATSHTIHNCYSFNWKLLTLSALLNIKKVNPAVLAAAMGNLWLHHTHYTKAIAHTSIIIMMHYLCLKTLNMVCLVYCQHCFTQTIDGFKI